MNIPHVSANAVGDQILAEIQEMRIELKIQMQELREEFEEF